MGDHEGADLSDDEEEIDADELSPRKRDKV